MIVDPARRALLHLAAIETRVTAILTDADQRLALRQQQVAAAAERSLATANRNLGESWTGMRATIATLNERCARLSDEARRLLISVTDRVPLRLDEVEEVTRHAMTLMIDRARRRLDHADTGEQTFYLLCARAYAIVDARLIDLGHRIEAGASAATRCLTQADIDLGRLTQLVEALDIAATLRRGFALVLAAANGSLIATRASASAARALILQFDDGPVAAHVDLFQSARTKGETQ